MGVAAELGGLLGSARRWYDAMMHTDLWQPRPPSAMGERPGTADITQGHGIRAATPGESCARTQTVRNFDLTPADTPGAPKPRKTRGRTPKGGEHVEANLPSLAASPLFATLMSARMSASMQRPDSAMSSPAFDSPTMPNDAAMMSFSSAFKDISLDESKQLPPLPANAKKDQASDFGDNYGIARRARLGVSAEGTPPCEPKAEGQQLQQQHHQKQDVVEPVQRPGSRLGFASATGFVESPDSSAERNNDVVACSSSATREEPAAPRESHGGRPVPRNLFAADASTVCPSSPHMPRPPPKR